MPSPMPVGGLAMTSLVLTGAVVGNAYYQKKQFYPSVVYITKSNPSMAAIYFLAFTLVILLGQLLKKVFFGQLRAAEFEHLIERSFYAVTETCLAFTVFRDDFSPKFVALFTVLLFLKAFHWLADSRVDYMERSPVITLMFHIRVTCLLFLLGFLDVLLINHAYHSTIIKGASVQLVFGFEYAILLTVALNIAVKYICHAIDLQSENPWENKAVYLLYTELLVGLAKVILYAIFMFIMIRIHTFPLFIIRPMYLTMRSFKKALNDVIQSRRAINNMNTLYPDATVQELAAVDNVCIICREEMTSGAKKLPCAHIFHTSCLRSWFQRQQTCPTCRMDILRQTSATTTHVNPPNPMPAQPNAQPASNSQQQQGTSSQSPTTPPQTPLNPFTIPGFPPFPLPGFPFPQQRPGTAGADGATASTSDGSTTSGTTLPTTPFNLIPPLFPMMSFNIPFPTAPPNFAGMTIEELRQLEGRERCNVEARIQALKNIQTLLDAAVFQMNQYTSVVTALDRETGAIPKTSRTSFATTVPSTSQEDSSSSASTNINTKTTKVTNQSKVEYLAPSNNENITPSSPVVIEATSSSSTIEASLPPSPSSPPSISSNDKSEEADELRRRRLEKFATELSS